MKNPHGIEFYSASLRKQMKYVYPDSPSYAGWLLFKHPDGQWVTYRKATDADLEEINAAVVKTHQAGNSKQRTKKEKR